MLPPPLPARTRLGFSWAGWRLALIGVATGSALGFLMQLRFGGHATGGEVGVLLAPLILAVPLANILLFISLAVRAPGAYWFYAAAVGIVVWATTMTQGMPLMVIEGGMGVAAIFMRLSALLFVITPFIKPRPTI